MDNFCKSEPNYLSATISGECIVPQGLVRSAQSLLVVSRVGSDKSRPTKGQE
jgi:hypothetical protein